MVSASFLATVLALSGSGNTQLLYFTADWCGACQSTKPAVQRLVSAGYAVSEVNVDRHPDLVAKFRVTAVPCFVMTADGREIERVAEASSYARLVQMFEKAGAHPVAQSPPSNGGSELVLGQSGGKGGLGLPRPLASLARNFGQRREPEERLVQIEAGAQPAAAPSHTLPPRTPGPDVVNSVPISAGVSHHNSPSVAGTRPGNLSSGAPSRAPGAAAAGSAAASPGDFQNKALQATVRLRVDDLSGHSVGTGTIIDSYNNEALIVTCGHIFRDSSGRGRIAVDLFTDNQPRTVNGTLISYDLERDLGLVAVPVSGPIKPVRIAPAGFRFERGQPVFSVGCDRGADPSVMASRITGIDRYVGSPNIEVAGQPVEGRSGGGLFSATGELIGVCNAADQSDNEGIFASLPAIHWELDRIGQKRIYAAQEPAAQEPAAQEPAAQETAIAQPSPRPQEPLPPKGNMTAPNAISAEPPRAALAIQPLAPAQQSGDDTEVICIVRSRANPQGTEKLLVLDRPSREFLDRLANESRPRQFPELAPAAQPIVRAQSDR